jgi:hypothetical protein
MSMISGRISSPSSHTLIAANPHENPHVLPLPPYLLPVQSVDLAPWKRSYPAELPTGEKGAVFALGNSTRRVGNNKLSPRH